MVPFTGDRFPVESVPGFFCAATAAGFKSSPPKRRTWPSLPNGKEVAAHSQGIRQLPRLERPKKRISGPCCKPLTVQGLECLTKSFLRGHHKWHARCFIGNHTSQSDRPNENTVAHDAVKSVRPNPTRDDLEACCLDRWNVPRGLDGFSAWPIQAGDVHSAGKFHQGHNRKLTYLEANRMSPHGLGALFRLGAPKPGHPSKDGSLAEAADRRAASNVARQAIATSRQFALDQLCKELAGAPNARHIRNHRNQPNAPSRLGRVFRLARPSQGIFSRRPNTRSPAIRAAPVTSHRSQKDAPMAWVGHRLICPSRGVQMG